MALCRRSCSNAATSSISSHLYATTHKLQDMIVLVAVASSVQFGRF
jgi:hypothetical protein